MHACAKAKVICHVHLLSSLSAQTLPVLQIQAVLYISAKCLQIFCFEFASIGTPIDNTQIPDHMLMYDVHL